MADVPESAVAPAVQAVLLAADDYGHDDIVSGSAERLARAALEAAAPLLAEAWGVADSENMRELIRANNQNLLAAAAEYYRLAYPGAAAKEKP